ncbi:unnamed protein product [Candida verbasci]|uniref:Uncharacterized protein n=1 Tax=Candida verbasci TaxID=1227364 RepID=A0A9W4U149_9ASCO|nr:unnamed protein product [Candida verbasci]
MSSSNDEFNNEIVKPELEHIPTPSTSTTTNKSPREDILPPSNLTDIESFDEESHQLHQQNHNLKVLTQENSNSSSSSINNRITINLRNLNHSDSNLKLNKFHNKRESVLSTFSQYSGKVETQAAVPVTLSRQDSTRIKHIKPQQEDEEEPIENDEDGSSDYALSIDTNDIIGDECSIIMGKLPTKSKNDDILIPTKSFNTNIEGAIPARSPNRPKSMVYSTNTKRQSMINDDLDKLMLDASSLNSKNFEEQEQNEKEDIVSPQILPKRRQQSHSSSILPPRPSQDSIRKAREISESIKKQQEQDQQVVENDDDYYDIEEIKPQQQQTPKRALSKRKRNKGKKNELKPFSYNTLISLLESMNGTIIGEEFNQLAIPIKEKQLIEKIIDSLSRLTSDMILDQQRYDIGITRLEKAIRVLEGFM